MLVSYRRPEFASDVLERYKFLLKRGDAQRSSKLIQHACQVGRPAGWRDRIRLTLARACGRVSQAGGQSRRQAADRFDVAISTAIHWIKRFEETGGAAPGQMGGHKKKVLAEAHAAWLRQPCLDHPFTLRGLVRELADERGLKVDYRSVLSFIHAEKLFLKKRR
jgi:putative transposase